MLRYISNYASSATHPYRFFSRFAYLEPEILLKDRELFVDYFDESQINTIYGLDDIYIPIKGKIDQFTSMMDDFRDMFYENFEVPNPGIADDPLFIKLRVFAKEMLESIIDIHLKESIFVEIAGIEIPIELLREFRLQMLQKCKELNLAGYNVKEIYDRIDV